MSEIGLNSVRKVAWAASLGDRSENADYQYNKKRLREIDRRVRYLRKCLEELGIVDYAPAQEGKVFFGAWVEVENDEGETKRFRIVGYDEIFERKDYISIDSPMARALLKKPRWLFVDEATSALDEAAEATLYARLQALVKESNGALVSIAHRPGVAAFHGTQWTFTPDETGQARYRLATSPT